jgi:hypothetical protein
MAAWRRLSFPSFTRKDLFSPVGLVVAIAWLAFLSPFIIVICAIL